jgi:hypothetical protein
MKYLLWTALLVLFTLSLSAQTAGRLAGTVTDATGAPLPGVTVTAEQTPTGLSRSTQSDNEGRYLFPNLPPSLYRLRATRDGFRTVVREDIELTVASSLTVDLTLQVGGIDQQITITDRPSLVNTQTSELSFLVGETAMRELPLNGRNFTDLALLTPGVTAFPHRDGGSVVAHGLAMSMNGRDPRSNVYLLDGTPQNDFTNAPASSAAGTALGLEAIREFRVELNAYSAQFGRNSGGQVNALTKSGGNDFHGSLFHFLRNDNFDARNFFDPPNAPNSTATSSAAPSAGPSAARKPSSSPPTNHSASVSAGPSPPSSPMPTPASASSPTAPSPSTPSSAPTSTNSPSPMAPRAAAASPSTPSVSIRPSTSTSARAASTTTSTVSTSPSPATPSTTPPSASPPITRSSPLLPLPQPLPDPRTPLGPLRPNRPHLPRVLRPHPRRTGRRSQYRRQLDPFIPGRGLVGNIDIGGLPRWGPQTSVNVQLVQNLFGFDYGFTHTRGRHLLKAGILAERYRNNMVNPTFSLGIQTFSNLRSFLENRPLRFLGLPAGGAIDRYWRSTLMGFYLQDDWRVAPRLTLNLGLRYEFATMPRDIYGRDSAVPNLLSDTQPTTGQLYQNPTFSNLSPRAGFAWDALGNGRLSVRGGYGLFFNTNNIQHLIVTVTNPPATPRVIVAGSTFPVPNLSAGVANSIRPIQWDIESPRVHVYNLMTEYQLPGDLLLSAGFAGSRGSTSGAPATGIPPPPSASPTAPSSSPPAPRRKNPSFGVVELKSSDGDSWYNAGLFELRRRFGRGLMLQSSYTFSRNIDTTQASTFFSDATNGTTTAFPEFEGFNYNKGLADYHAKHNWVSNFLWNLPLGQHFLAKGWQLAGIYSLRSGNPLTVFVQSNRSRSLAQPSLGPGIGFDRVSMAPGFTHQSAIQGDPGPLVQPRRFRSPTRRTTRQPRPRRPHRPQPPLFRPLPDAQLPLRAISERANLQFRFESFNLANRANFGPPALTAFAGSAVQELPLSSLGFIRQTVTSARQLQLALRLSF